MHQNFKKRDDIFRFFENKPALVGQEERNMNAMIYDIFRTKIIPLIESENFYHFEKSWCACFASYCSDIHAPLAIDMIKNHFFIATGKRNWARDEALARAYLKMFRLPSLKKFHLVEAEYMKLILNALCSFKIRPQVIIFMRSNRLCKMNLDARHGS